MHPSTLTVASSRHKRYTYEPYGKEIGPDPNDPNPWRYASGYFDKQTSWLKFGTRYYDPGTSRWTQPDPIRGDPNNPMTLNLYLYVGSNPVDSTDPFGRFFHDDFSLESIFEVAVTQFLGTLVGGSVGVACWGVAQYFTAGTALVAATAGCYAAGRATGIWVAYEARQMMNE